MSLVTRKGVVAAVLATAGAGLRDPSVAFALAAENVTGSAVLVPRIRDALSSGPWFYLLAGLGAGCVVVFFIHRMRSQRLRGEFLAVFNERKRVARELHDSLLQGLAAAALELGNLREQLAASDRNASARLEAVENVIASSMAETRRLVWNLRDEATGTGDLDEALWRLAARLTDRGTVTCSVDAQGPARPLPQGVQGSLFLVAQEALTNAVKHARARRIDLRLVYEPDSVILSVTDDGCGFELERAGDARSGHFGLLGMRERARSLGAKLDLRSGSGEGTAVTLQLSTSGRSPADAS